MILFLLIAPQDEVGYADSWDSATISTQDLYAVWGASDRYILVAGEQGTLLYSNGSSWQEITTSAISDLNSLWGIYNEVVFSVGNSGTLLGYDGSSWSESAPIIYNLNALWGSSSTNVYAVGEYGKIFRYDGTSWEAMDSQATSFLYCLWGSASDNVYAGGENGKLIHYNGSIWETVPVPTVQTLLAIWGSSGSDIYASDLGGNIIHYDGTLPWETVTTINGIELYALWGSSAEDIFAAGSNNTIYHYYDNGVSLGWYDITNSTPVSSISNIRAIWGSTSGKVYFVGQNGTILIYSRDDHIPPVINNTGLSRDNNGKVYVSTPVTFYFSEEMDQSTISSATLTLKSGVTAVPGTVTLSSDHMSADLRGDLAYSTTYTATVTAGSSGVKDITGNALESVYSVTFTIEPRPVSSGGGASGCFISTAGM